MIDAKTIAGYLNLASGATALVAAALWFFSTWVTRPYVEKVSKDGWIPGGISQGDAKGKRTNPFESAAAQAAWNRWAAFAAGVAAFFLGIALLLA
ncbi:hypothetical protein [Cupriavidus necator]|uniref:hypothetical protein n=1 Tax=Cupriavidus necator TaxID=106590 RepID=UPI00339D55F5